jgi:nucleoside 2-deoxyribosyltransferase
MRTVYYAAPFFNSEEMSVMHHFQHIATPHPHLRVFYPYEASLEDQENIQDKSARRKVYLKNEQALIHNSELIAWIDRKQLDGHQIQRCRLDVDTNNLPGEWIGDGRELKQPDLGTVWEMGFARARGKTIAAFTLQEGGKLNLMLTESVDIVLHGWNELETYLALPHSMDVQQYIRDKAGFWKGDVE